VRMLIGICVLCCGIAYGREKPSTHECTHDEENFRCVKFVRAYDGDTVTIQIPETHQLLGHNIGIRIHGIDTPELRTKNKCEKALGYKARDYVRSILKNARRIDLNNVSRGKYFRIVAEIVADGKSIGELLIQKKYAYRYDGGTKKKIDWCRFGTVAH